jgi:hypothetical protein
MPTSATGTGLGELRRLGIRKPANRPGMIRKIRGAERIFCTPILKLLAPWPDFPPRAVPAANMIIAGPR